ncbi:bZIP transcription factor 60 [Cardamine amara subsp. amara]|uniref:BZIP transcription factor 60 n=1 Tax=Cardamine amara subsp. amara TaxID=228776 RepID=A0ABD0ZH68_CARAN
MAEESCCFDLLSDDDIFFDFDPSILSDFPPVEEFVQSSPDSWIGEIENQLMNDDNYEMDQESSFSEFLADILVDSPTDHVDLATDEVSDVFTVESLAAGKELEDSEKEKKSNDSGSEIQDGDKVESEIEGDDDPVAKKRRRQVRNRDAAVRSRERKKEYVQDLEKKSKYLERECLRLGRMLECFAAENQSLRLCLQKGSGNNASMSSKQESAVLLLESLLLGSLLWFLLGVNIICQFPYLSHTKCYLLRVEPEKLVLSGLGGNTKPSNTCVSRRCKGSRPRMKYQILTHVA